jgi:DNA-directed RNA polymerase specialized sigma24 family protein
MGHHRADSSITEERLARLLARLGPDAERAAQEYAQLHRALVRYFDWRGVYPPDEAADEAVDRLAARLETDAGINDVRGFALGIARMLLHEWRRRPVPKPLDWTADIAHAPQHPGRADRLQECFDRCLHELSPDAQSLLLGYYDGQLRAKIANRRRIAQSLGVSESALRSRVQRLRDRIESCVQQRLAEGVKG